MATMARVVTPEVLDHLAPADPTARRSRRDLQRVHVAMGTCGIVARGWQALLGDGPITTPLQILELGAGDGTLLLGVARALGPVRPPVQLTLLDRQALVSPATLAGYAELGWDAEVAVADVADWRRGPLALARWDLITTSLFLHHFEGSELAALLAAIASRTERFFACEPRRAGLALVGSHLVAALGANAVTRHDAVLSVHAGFRAFELSAAWPGPATAWSLNESAAGLFSHCFSAGRIGAVDA